MSSTSYRWTIQEYEVINETEKQIRVKVKALSPTMSRNGRKYDFNEMMQSHRSIRGQLINVNHNNSRKIGNTDGSSINMEQRVMEVLGVVNKEPYVTMLKEHDPKIRGWSVQADFQKAKCVHCPREFESMEALKTHLIEEEHIHNVTFTPTEIKFNGLALVVDPEQPGMPDTSYEIAETTAKSFGSLQEMVDSFESEAQPDSWLLKFMSNKEEDKEMSKIAVETHSSSIAVGHSPTISMQEKTALKSESLPLPKTDQKPPVVNAPAEPLLKQLTEEINIKLKELKLGEPFADYTDFADCVAKNSDKPDPEAYCGAIKAQAEETVKLTVRESAGLSKLEFIAEGSEYPSLDACVADGNTRKECAAMFDQVEERNNANKKVVEAYNKIVEWLNSPIVVALPKVNESWKKQNKQLTEALNTVVAAVNSLPKDDLSWRDIKPYDDSELREAVAALKIPEPYNDTAIKEMIAAIPKYDDAPLKEQLSAIKPYDDAVIKTDIATLKEATKEITTLKETVVQQKKEFDALLDAADKSVKEYFAANKKELTEKDGKIKELTEKLEFSLKETAEAKRLAENVNDKLNPAFKGHSKTIKETAQPDFTYKPGGA